MANSRLSFVIAIKLATGQFNKATTAVKSQLLSLQRNFLAFASAVGAGTLGLTGLISKMVETAKETSRATIALKNVTASTGEFANAQRWLIDLSKRYGVEINTLTTSYAKFKAAADISNMSLEDQRKVFESVARASVAFGLSAEDQKGVFMALQQMMSKNKVMAEELRLQLSERMPVAIQAMAKAAGVTVGELDSLMKQGKVLSSEVLPKFADALNSMIADPDTNNLNKSLIDLENTFTDLTKQLNVEGVFKRVIDSTTSILQKFVNNTNAVFKAVEVGALLLATKGVGSFFKGFANEYDAAVSAAVKAVEGGQRAIDRVAKAKHNYDLALAEQSEAIAAKQIISEQTSAEERIQIENRVKAANELVKKRETEHFKACEKQKRASANATAEIQVMAAQKGATGLTRFANIAKYSFAQIGNAIKGFLKANVYTAIIAVLYEMTQKVIQLASAYGKLRKAKENSLKDIKYSSSAEATQLEILRQNLQIGQSFEARSSALKEINNLLGTEYELADLTKGVYEEINATLIKRAELLSKQEQLNKAVNSIAEKDARLNELREKSATEKVTRIGPFAFNTGGLSTKEKLEYKTLTEERNAISKWIENNYGSGISIAPATAPTNKPTQGSDAGQIKMAGILSFETRKGLEDLLDRADKGRKEAMAFLQEAELLINESLGIEDTRWKQPTELLHQRADQRWIQANEGMQRQRDKSGDWKLSDIEIKVADLEFEESRLEEMKHIMEEYGVDLSKALAEGMAKTSNLKDAINIEEAQSALADLQKQMNETKFGAIKDGISDIDGIVNAFDRLNEAMSDGASGWEKIMAVWEVFSSVAEGIIGVIEAVAQAQEIAAQMEKVSAATKIQAKTGEAAAEVGGKVAKESKGWAALIAVPAAIAAILAAFSAIPKFANGGIVGGTSKQGDKVLARLNSGEGVLTPEGLESLHDAANPRNRRNVQVTGVLRAKGRELVALIETENKYKNRIK